jgi:UDP-glucose 4-epimerase
MEQQSLAIEAQRRDHRQLGSRQFERKRMFLEDLCVAPAARPVELEHQRAVVRRAELVDAVLIAVQREQATVAFHAERFRRRQDGVRRQSREGLLFLPAHSCALIPARSCAAGHTQCRARHAGGGPVGYDLGPRNRHFPHPGHPMAHSTVLVTGGAGYIGSHVVLQLRERGEKRGRARQPGHRASARPCSTCRWSWATSATANSSAALLREHGIDTVLHFAAHTIVPESVRNPLKYYGNNTCSTRSLLQSCAEAGVRHFVFSSTAAVYGVLADGYAERRHTDRTHQPLWHVQADVRMDAARPVVRDPAAATSCCAISTSPGRTRRVASASRPATRPCSSRWPPRRRSASAPACRCSGRTIPRRTAPVSARLHPRHRPRDGPPRCPALPARRGRFHDPELRLWPRLQRPRGAAVGRAGQWRRIAVREEPRREGDPPVLVARADRIKALLGWTPALDDLDQIVRSSLEWEKKLLASPW